MDGLTKVNANMQDATMVLEAEGPAAVTAVRTKLLLQMGPVTGCAGERRRPMSMTIGRLASLAMATQVWLWFMQRHGGNIQATMSLNGLYWSSLGPVQMELGGCMVRAMPTGIVTSYVLL